MFTRCQGFDPSAPSPYHGYNIGIIYCKQLTKGFIYIYIWVNYNDLTATALEIMVSKGNHPQMALIQVSEIL